MSSSVTVTPFPLDAGQYTRYALDRIKNICESNGVKSIVHFKGFASGIDFSAVPSQVKEALLDHLGGHDAIFWDGDNYDESSFTYMFRLLAERLKLQSTIRYPTLICLKLHDEIEEFKGGYDAVSLGATINCIEISRDIFDTEELKQFKQIPGDILHVYSDFNDSSFSDNVYLAMGTYFVHLSRILMDDGVISTRNVACIGGFKVVHLEYLIDSHKEPALTWHYFHCSRRTKSNEVQEGVIHTVTGANITKYMKP